MHKVSYHFMRSTRFQAGCLACGLTGLAMCAPAQLSLWSSGSSSSDTFGGDPDSNAFIRIPSDTDDWTLSLLTNDEVIAVDQDSPTWPARRVEQYKGVEVWVRGLKDGSKAVGLFNRCAAPATVELIWGRAGLDGRQMLRNLWQHKDLGTFDESFSLKVPAHGAVLLRATPAGLAN